MSIVIISIDTDVGSFGIRTFYLEVSHEAQGNTLRAVGCGEIVGEEWAIALQRLSVLKRSQYQYE